MTASPSAAFASALVNLSTSDCCVTNASAKVTREAPDSCRRTSIPCSRSSSVSKLTGALSTKISRWSLRLSLANNGDGAIRFSSREAQSSAAHGLQALDIGELGHVPIESAQGNVPGLTSDLEDQTVGESERRPFAEEIESGRDDLGVLQREAFMIEQNGGGGKSVGRRALVPGVE